MDSLKQVINKKTLATLNEQLGKQQKLYDEICKAERAGVPMTEELKQACLDRQEAIKKFKQVYFPTSN